MDQKRKSTGGSKSRGGCITCKSRRVKCDETKPTCIRCSQMHLICGGYIIRSNKWKQTSQDASRRLLPLLPKISATLTAAATPMVPSPPQRLFTNDQELRYFRVFCDSTALNFGEYLDSTLWSHIVLQAAEQEFFIKHAIVALGALDKSLDGPTAPRDVLELGLKGDPKHSQVAFQHYGKSIQGIRKACEEKRRSKRTILIACLLAICFEYRYGNVDVAVMHIENGVKLIDEWFRSVRHLASINEKHQSMLPGIIEDELISVFARLELDVSVWQAKHFRMHPDLEMLAMKIIQIIPDHGFVNLKSARTCFDIVLQQVDWFVRSIHEQLWAISEKSADLESETKSDDRFLETVPSVNQIENATAFQKIIRDWSMAFQPLVKRASKSGGIDLLTTKAFCLRLACSSIALDCCFGPELRYDDSVSEFHAALSLAEDLCSVTTSAGRSAFIISSILIRSLFFIATKCRLTDSREKANVLLRSMSRREGIWDARIASIFATAIMRLEEGSRNSVIPEHKRLRAIKTSFDIHKRQGRLQYLKQADLRKGGFVSREMEVSW